jgi:5-methyltetrahydrofolate--homocysteine methyltransferase
MSIKDLLGKSIIVFDGAMGTQLQTEGLMVGELPEVLNIEHADIVKNIHLKYLDAGCDVVTTNTFGANRLRAEGSGYSVHDLVSSAVKNCRAAVSESGKNAFVALDIGPSGKIIGMMGDIDFDESYELNKEQVLAGVEAGADLIIFETFSDLYEIKSGILAAKENSNLPVFCTLTFESDGRMLMGSDVETTIYALQDMGIDAIGINCSLGPEDTLPLIARMAKISKLPIIVQPNAGLPREENGETYYDVEIEPFVECMMKMLEVGVAVCGGCCGTSPDYIAALRAAIDAVPVGEQKNRFKGIDPTFLAKKIEASVPSVCATTKTTLMDGRVRVIGERINPTGKKALKEALKNSDYDYVLEEAVSQVAAGAEIVDINAGSPEIDEGAALEQIVRIISAKGDIPLVIDGKVPEFIDRAVRICRGKPIINSVSGESESLNSILPIAAKYGTPVIALTLDDNGLPKTAEERIAILKRIMAEAAKYGISKDRIVADTLALTVSVEAESLGESVRALRMAKEECGVKTTIGSSNVSFGLPDRPLVNGTFLAMAVYAGLDAPITDPTVEEYMDTIRAAEVLTGKDLGAEDYISSRVIKPLDEAKVAADAIADFQAKENREDGALLREHIINGAPEKAAAETKIILENHDALWIIDHIIVPVMETIGDSYEDGTIFLPQMIRSADAVKKAFEVLKASMSESGNERHADKIVLATVKGDIHDIGKNIVKSMLENYGYEIIDLGKDVPPEVVVEAVRKDNVGLVGLSALMTTTVHSMEETIVQLREAGLDCKVAVGGAVMTKEYAEKIGADFYCANAVDSVRAAKEVFSPQ